MKYLLIIIVLFLFSCDHRNKPKEIDHVTPVMETLEGNADLLFQMNNYAEAIKAYSELIDIDSMNGEYYNRQGYCYTQLKDHKFITDDFIPTAQLGYRKFDCYYDLGIIFISGSNDSLSFYYAFWCRSSCIGIGVSVTCTSSGPS